MSEELNVSSDYGFSHDSPQHGNLAVVEGIKNRSFFVESLNWYCDVYMLPFAERSWMIIVNLLLIFCLVFQGYGIYSLYPLHTSFNLIKYTERNSDEFTVVKDISLGSSEHSYPAIAKYLIKNYVETRESYNHDDVARTLRYIKNNSSRKIFMEYESSGMPEYASLSKKYIGNHAYKIIAHVRSIDLGGLQDLDYAKKAKVMVYVEEKLGSVILHTREFVVDLDYALSNLQMVKSGAMPIDFRIMSYYSGEL